VSSSQPDNDQKLRFSQHGRRGAPRHLASTAELPARAATSSSSTTPNNAKEVLSEAIIEATNEDWWDGTMSTRLNDPKTGAFIVIQQRLGENDLSGHIQRKEDWPDWCHLMLPMEYERDRAAMIYPNIIGWSDPREEEGELLWPARFGHKEVTTLKSNLGSWRAAGQLQQRPEPQGGGIIKRDHWQLWPPEGEATDDLGNIVKPAAFPPMDYILASLDTAYTLDNMNDPSALTVWGVFSGDVIARDLKVSDTMTQRVYGTPAARVMLMYAWTGREELHGLVNRVNRICGRGPGGMRVDKLLIENKGPGISVAQELRRLFANGGYAVQLNDPGRTDKVARLYSVQNIFEELAVFAPERSWSEAVMHQCGSFPNGEHDDSGRHGLPGAAPPARHRLVDPRRGALRRAGRSPEQRHWSRLFRHCTLAVMTHVPSLRPEFTNGRCQGLALV
jgi:predicted phage terminase large subunit-like protein